MSVLIICWKNTMKSGIKSGILGKSDLTGNWCAMKNTWNLQKSLMVVKSIPIFMVKKNSQRRFLLCVFLFLLLMCVLICKINENYYSHVFLEKCKYIEIEKRWSNTLLKTQGFLLLINIMPLKKILTNLLK